MANRKDMVAKLAEHINKLSDDDLGKLYAQVCSGGRNTEKAQPGRYDEDEDDPGADEEKKKVAAHYGQYAEKFSEYGTSRKDLVNAFSAARRRDPKLTAEKFLRVNKTS
jgi:hypothetical protein